MSVVVKNVNDSNDLAPVVAVLAGSLATHPAHPRPGSVFGRKFGKYVNKCFEEKMVLKSQSFKLIQQN